jgi:predicted aldo/keto reductase-like oxidoreductase
VLTFLLRQTLEWRNWQTRRTQNPVAARPCGFDSLLEHHLYSRRESFARDPILSSTEIVMKNSSPESENQKMDSGLTRRKFLETTVGTTVASAMAGSLLPSAHADAHVAATDAKNGIPYRTLGNTGEKVSSVGLGGYHLGMQSDVQESIRIIRTGLDEGINFLDNCWDYNGGESEIRMGKALRDGYRQKAFLMTKIDSHTKQGATSQINESLRRLQTDHVDLLQFHEVIRDSDPEAIFAPNGALEAAVAAKQQGKIRYIGFTGHKSPQIHLKMLNTAFAHKFTFNSVQMPLNLMDAHYDSFEKLVLPVLVAHNIGVLGMKPMGDGLILRSKTAEPVECLQYALNLPTSVVITGCDSVAILQQALQTARTFRPLSQEQVAALLAKTEKAAQTGEHELYKTAHNFDGTIQNPQWLE